MKKWRVTELLSIYEGETRIGMCASIEDAKNIVEAHNRAFEANNEQSKQG